MELTEIDALYAKLGQKLLQEVDRHAKEYRPGNLTIIPVMTPSGLWVDLYLQQPYKRAVDDSGREYVVREPAKDLH